MSFSFDPQRRSAGTAGALGLALVMEEVAVPRCCPCELGSAVGARSLGGLARFLTLVPEEVAEGRELAAVAAVLPALGLGATLNDANLAGIRRAAHDRGNRVHHAGVGHYGSTRPPGNVSYKRLRGKRRGERRGARTEDSEQRGWGWSSRSSTRSCKWAGGTRTGRARWSVVARKAAGTA